MPVGQAIENLSNALMGDRRVFHMDREFMLLFLKQGEVLRHPSGSRFNWVFSAT